MPPEHQDGDQHPLGPMLAALDRLRVRLDDLVGAARLTLDRFNERVQAASRALGPIGEWIAKNGPVIAASLIAMRRYAAEAHIENWGELDDQEWMAAVELVQTDGVPLAWLPRTHVVKALVAAADHAERNAILLTNASEIADDAEELLAAVDHARLIDLTASVDQAWAAWRDGHTAAAHALAAVCVGEVIEQHREFDDFADFRKRYEQYRAQPVEDWTVAVAFRRTVLDCALLAAILRRDQQIAGFNRHAAVHSVSPEQYTSANCVRALMLVTALTRELQFDYASEWSSAPVAHSRHPGPLNVTRQRDLVAGSQLLAVPTDADSASIWPPTRVARALNATPSVSSTL
jgi:hypothetical protein